MFAKIFAQIYDSSLVEDWKTRLVFTDFLTLSDEHGIVDMTPAAIARRTNVPPDIVKNGIAALEQPDKESRSSDCEGRRIVRIDSHRDWGWRIVNFDKYRTSATKQMLRMGEAERKAEWRKRKGLPPVPPSKRIEAEAEAEAEADKSGTSPGQVRDIKARPASVEAVIAFCSGIGIASDAEYFWEKWNGNGFQNAGRSMKCWKSTIRSWKAAGHLPSQKNNQNHNGKSQHKRTEQDRDADNTGYGAHNSTVGQKLKRL